MTEYTHFCIGYGLSLIVYFMFYHRATIKMYKQLKKMKSETKNISELSDAMSFNEFKQHNIKTKLK